MIRTPSGLIPAFPVEAHTLSHTPTDFDMTPPRFQVLVASADCTLTCTFAGSVTIVMPLAEGQAVALSDQMLTLTATQQVTMT